MKTTAFICASVMTLAAGLTASCLLSGCARHYSRETISPPNQMPSDQKFRYDPEGANTRPLSYQWYFTNSNPETATFSVTAVGDAPLHYEWSFATNTGMQSFGVTNAPLSYQWSLTNGEAVLQQSDFGSAGGTNGPLYYEWYQNTNNP